MGPLLRAYGTWRTKARFTRPCITLHCLHVDVHRNAMHCINRLMQILILSLHSSVSHSYAWSHNFNIFAFRKLNTNPTQGHYITLWTKLNTSWGFLVRYLLRVAESPAAAAVPTTSGTSASNRDWICSCVPLSVSISSVRSDQILARKNAWSISSVCVGGGVYCTL